MTARYLIDKSALVRMLLEPVKLAKTGRHRVPIPDLVIAAAAEDVGLVVLHYDKDFEVIAEVTGQSVEWVVPRGSL